MNKSIRIFVFFVIWIIIILTGSEWVSRSDFPWSMSSMEAYFIRDNSDYWGHNAFEIQRIRKNQSDNEFIVFIGGSTALEAISTDMEMNKLLNDKTKNKISFISLASSHKSFADEYKIIDAIGKSNATIIISIEVLRFTKGIDRQLHMPERLINSPYYNKYYYISVNPLLNRILKNYNADISIKNTILFFNRFKYLGDFIKTRVKCYFKNGIISPKFVVIRHHTEKSMPNDEKFLKEQNEWLTKMSDKYKTEYALNRDLLKGMIDLATKNGNKVILLDLPISPVFVEKFDNVNGHYKKMIQEIVTEKKLKYYDLNDETDWDSQDFRDVHHITKQGRAKFMNILSRRINENRIE